MSDTNKIFKELSKYNLSNVPMYRIVTPVGMNFKKWHVDRKEKYMNKHMVGGFDNLSQITFMDNPIFSSWINFKELQNINITPSTLIPLGILIFIYNVFTKQMNYPKKRSDKDSQSGGGSNKIADHDLSKELINVFKYSAGSVNPSLLVPFGLLMGRDILMKVSENNKNDKNE